VAPPQTIALHLARVDPRLKSDQINNFSPRPQQLSATEYRQKIIEKDASTIDLYRTLYNIEIGNDLSPFDLILDISSLITESSLEASIRSIRTAHEIIRPAAAWFLTRHGGFLDEFRAAADKHQSLIVRNTLLA
jgi:hypothetical protein